MVRLIGWIFILLCGLLFPITKALADFTNGGFEDSYTTPSPNTIPNINIPGWTSTGYLFTGYKAGLTLPPKSLNDITLTASPKAPNGITDIISGTTQTLTDYFLVGIPGISLKLPEVQSQTAMVNLRSVTPKQSVSGTSAKPSGWATYGQQATALSQKITIGSGDINLVDNKVHILFKIAAVMENPAHTAKQQPFYAIQINNLTKGRTGSNPLYFQWSYAAQPGVPWKTVIQKGSNSGSNASYTFVDWQNYNLAFSNTDISEGDEVELIVLAAGCSPGGHDGHVYLDNVTTNASGAAGLLISASGDASTTPGGTITYTYTYQNNGGASANNTKIVAFMPVTQNSSVPYATIFKNTTGPCTFNQNLNAIECNLGTLTAGQTGSFQMEVYVPSDWPTSYGPINNGNYSIGALNINPVLGNLVQTTMNPAPPPPSNSFLVVDVTGLGTPNVPHNTDYTGTYTCTNTGGSTASNATCDITNLPPGINQTITCTLGGSLWQTPSDIPAGQTVECTVSKRLQSPISKEYDVSVSSDSTNNTNSTSNHAIVPFKIYNNPVDIPATLNGSTVISPAPVCCGRPILTYDLPIGSDLAATYSVVKTTGNIRCSISHTGTHYYVKVFGRPGTCTIQGLKNDEISKPLVLVAN
jgi:hypothetical protein